MYQFGLNKNDVPPDINLNEKPRTSGKLCTLEVAFFALNIVYIFWIKFLAFCFVCFLDHSVLLCNKRFHRSLCNP